MTPERFEHYRTHVPIIDKSHLEIFEIINSLKADCNNYIDATEKINLLVKTFHDHCIKEELFLVKIKYPYLEHHRLDHMRMIGKLKLLTTSKFLMHRLYILDDFKMKVVDHTDQHDFQVSAYIKDHPEVEQSYLNS